MYLYKLAPPCRFRFILNFSTETFSCRCHEFSSEIAKIRLFPVENFRFFICSLQSYDCANILILICFFHILFYICMTWMTRQMYFSWVSMSEDLFLFCCRWILDADMLDAYLITSSRKIILEWPYCIILLHTGDGQNNMWMTYIHIRSLYFYRLLKSLNKLFANKKLKPRFAVTLLRILSNFAKNYARIEYILMLIYYKIMYIFLCICTFCSTTANLLKANLKFDYLKSSLYLQQTSRRHLWQPEPSLSTSVKYMKMSDLYFKPFTENLIIILVWYY